jgi:hypothetical protein
MRISNVYKQPSIDLYIDPWQLLNSDHLSFSGDSELKAVLSDTSSAIMTDSKLDIFPRHGYSHRPLFGKEIRLLTLLPSRDNENPVRALLTHKSITNAGNFRALSYVWGSGVQSCIVETPAGFLRVTPSLHSALRHLRPKSNPITLWVDAVCINQDDTGEKASQIKLLPHVYQHAVSTLVFLGDDTMDDHAIITLMQIRARAKQAEIQSSSPDTPNYGVRTRVGKDEWPSCLPPIPSAWSDEPIPNPGDPFWDHVIRFFGHPWFQRAWVIQEVVLASTVRVIVGKWIVDWNDLFGAVEIIDKFRPTLETPWDGFVKVATYREREARQNRMALIELLESFRHVKSTLTRDRLFALRGLAADSHNPAFEPDYESPLKTIACRVARALIEQGKVLLLLYRAGLAARQSAVEFPSWIPDWTVTKQPCLWESSHRGARFAASWKNTPRVICGPLITEIAVYGMEIDVVKDVSETSCTAIGLRGYLDEVDEMVQTLESQIYDRPEELRWQVPVAGARYPRTTTDIETDLHTSYKALRKVLGIDEESEPSSPSESILSFSDVDEGNLKDVSENYKRALLESLEGWRFFTTGRGFVGVGPAATHKGDKVAIFDGSAVPSLTREYKRVDEKWVCKFVGECYIHGLMNGEAKKLKSLDEGWVTLC